VEYNVYVFHYWVVLGWFSIFKKKTALL
jgi:hypothetical protein